MVCFFFLFLLPSFCENFTNLKISLYTHTCVSTGVGLTSDLKAHTCSVFTLGVFIFTLVVLHRYRMYPQMYLFQSGFSIFTSSVRRTHEWCQGVYISMPSPAETIAPSHYLPVIHEQTLHDPSARAHDAGGQGWLSPSWLVCVGIMVSQMRWYPGWLSLPFPPARRSSVWILVHILKTYPQMHAYKREVTKCKSE